MSEISSKESHRVFELDVLRGLAALAVLLSHFTAYYDHLNGFTNRLGFSFTIGSYAVSLFFVISGYVILMTLEKCATSADFMVSRFSRIFPAYWGALVITFFLLQLLKPSPPGVIELFVNFTMLQRFFGLEHLDSVYWTLNVELSFYFWMLLLFKSGLIARLNLTIAAVLFFQLSASIFQTIVGTRFSQGVQAVFLLEYVNLFCAGMLFYRMRNTGLTKASAALLFWCLVNTHFVPFRRFEWTPPPEWGIPAVFIIFVVFWCAISGRISWIISTPDVFLGTISYTLYLLHNEVGRAIMFQLSRMGYHPWVTFFVALAGVLLLATSLTLFVERPALKWIRRTYSKWKDRRELSTPSVSDSK